MKFILAILVFFIFGIGVGSYSTYHHLFGSGYTAGAITSKLAEASKAIASYEAIGNQKEIQRRLKLTVEQSILEYYRYKPDEDSSFVGTKTWGFFIHESSENEIDKYIDFLIRNSNVPKDLYKSILSDQEIEEKVKVMGTMPDMWRKT